MRAWPVMINHLNGLKRGILGKKCTKKLKVKIDKMLNFLTDRNMLSTLAMELDVGLVRSFCHYISPIPLNTMVIYYIFFLPKIVDTNQL